MNEVLSSEEERQPLIQNQTPSVRSHNFDDFYSPIDSPQGNTALHSSSIFENLLIHSSMYFSDSDDERNGRVIRTSSLEVSFAPSIIPRVISKNNSNMNAFYFSIKTRSCLCRLRNVWFPLRLRGVTSLCRSYSGFSLSSSVAKERSLGRTGSETLLPLVGVQLLTRTQVGRDFDRTACL